MFINKLLLTVAEQSAHHDSEPTRPGSLKAADRWTYLMKKLTPSTVKPSSQPRGRSADKRTSVGELERLRTGTIR